MGASGNLEWDKRIRYGGVARQSTKLQAQMKNGTTEERGRILAESRAARDGGGGGIRDEVTTGASVETFHRRNGRRDALLNGII